MNLKQIIRGTDSRGRESHATGVSSLLTGTDRSVWVSARKAGWEDAASVTAVAVEGWKRFGNSVLQTANALAVAVHYRLKGVYLPGWWWLQGGRYELAGGLRVVNRRGVALDDEEIIAVDRFCDLGPASGVATGGVSPAEALGWLREWLVVRPAGGIARRSLVTGTLRARELVAGKSTFAMAVAALSEHLEEGHSLEHVFSPWGNGRVRVTEWRG